MARKSIRRCCTLILWLSACTAPAAQPTDVPAIAPTILPPTTPTATPDCQPAAGVTVTVQRLTDTTALLHATGLQPGEIPSVFYSTSNGAGKSSRTEAWGFANGADAHGEFSFELHNLQPPEGQTTAAWDIRLVHRRGVACAQITVPLSAEISATPMASPTYPWQGFVVTTPESPQPTPPAVIGGGVVSDGPFIFDLRLFRDASFGRNPVAASLYGDLEGIGSWLYWFYDGTGTVGPVKTYWGTLPHLDQLLQETYASIPAGSSGGRTGGVMLPGGFFTPGESRPGDRVRVALEVILPDASYGAVLAFTLTKGPHGFEPAGISVGPLDRAQQPSP